MAALVYSTNKRVVILVSLPTMKHHTLSMRYAQTMPLNEVPTYDSTMWQFNARTQELINNGETVILVGVQSM